MINCISVVNTMCIGANVAIQQVLLLHITDVSLKSCKMPQHVVKWLHIILIITDGISLLITHHPTFVTSQ